MDARQIKGKEKVHYRDSSSEDSDEQTYKRSRQAVPETMPKDVPEQQNPHGFWKVRDQIGWKHGIMVSENRHHWQCKYCSMTGKSGGLSGLKSHLSGDGKKARKCLAVPEDVSAEIKRSMNEKKEKRRERAALNSTLRRSAQGSMVLAHVPGGACYCYFCTVERAQDGPEETVVRLLHGKMVQVVDMMLSAAEQLSAEEQSLED